MVTASAVRRPCRYRSSTGPITGAISANGAIVTSRYSATRPRAASAATPKNTVPARPIVTSVSPAQEIACRSSSRVMPASPAPPRCRANITRRVTHLFECQMPGYRGWRWAVTVARVPRSKQVTVCETVLLPGPDALVPPEWVPWHDRLQPGDLGVGDVMVTSGDDDRLVPGYLLS